MFAYLLLLLSVASLAAIAWPWFAHPKPAPFVAGILGTVVLSGLAVGSYLLHRDLERRWGQAEYYAFPTASTGSAKILIRTLPDVPGLRAALVKKGSRPDPSRSLSPEPIPFSFDQLLACRWRASVGGEPIHTHDARCECAPKTSLFDFHLPLDRGAVVELEYGVDETTKPMLEQLELRVTYPSSYRFDLIEGMGVVGASLVAFGALASLGVVGVLLLVRRRVRAARAA